jgi:lysophospholipid acyltransferase (LPLAT)-like uncharacterized protein
MKSFIKTYGIALLILLYSRIIKLTCKIQVQNRDALDRFWLEDKPVMMPVWHGRLFFFTIMPKFRHPVTAMISLHKDGRMVAAYAKFRKAGIVDGSSSTGAIKAMKAMIDAGKKGHTLLTTPDGPRGPAYQLSRGTLEMGRLSGLPITPLCGTATKVKVLKSWDNFMIPLPFSTITIHIGEPHHCPFKSDKDQRKGSATILESAMRTQREWLDDYHGPIKK